MITEAFGPDPDAISEVFVSGMLTFDWGLSNGN